MSSFAGIYIPPFRFPHPHLAGSVELTATDDRRNVPTALRYCARVNEFAKKMFFQPLGSLQRCAELANKGAFRSEKSTAVYKTE